MPSAWMSSAGGGGASGPGCLSECRRLRKRSSSPAIAAASDPASLAAAGLGPSAARARTRSARLTTPTIRPSWSTGTRLMRCAVSSRAISPISVSSPTVTTGLVMTSRAVRPGTRRLATNAASSVSPSASRLSHQSRRFSRPASSRPIRSPSLTMPAGAPAASMTGTALIAWSRRTCAISCVGVAGPTDTTAEVITSRAFTALDLWFERHASGAAALI